MLNIFLKIQLLKLECNYLHRNELFVAIWIMNLIIVKDSNSFFFKYPKNQMNLYTI